MKKAIIISFFYVIITSPFIFGLDFEPNVVIVTTKPSGFKIAAKNSIETFNTDLGAISTKKIVVKNNSLKTASQTKDTFLVRFPEDCNLEETIKKYQEQEWVAKAEPNYYVYARNYPNDPKAEKQSYFFNTGLNLLLNLPVNKRIIVAVLDSGINYFHPDINNNIRINHEETFNGKDDDNNGYVDDINGYNFVGFSQDNDNNNPMDDFGHGTHIAGIIAAEINNDIGITGINPYALILNVKFLDSQGRGTQADAAAAIYYAVATGAQIINCSWGYYKYSTIIKDALDYASANGVLILGAVGNQSSDLQEYPAAFENVIAVSAISIDNQPTGFTNYGDYIDYAQYGSYIYSLYEDSYTYMSGTSQSTAVLSGIISRIWAAYPDKSANEIQVLLEQATEDIYESGKDEYTGYGVFSAGKLFSNLALSLPTNNYIVPVIIDAGQELVSEGDDTQDTILLPASVNLVLEELMNFPNPFGASGTYFGFNLTTTAGSTGEMASPIQVAIHIFDLTGRKVKYLESIGMLSYQKIFWNGRDESGSELPNGTYIYLFECNSGETILRKKGKLTILR
ncbi:S8 family serine peptidase [Candidatus Margulisiibacteriota bacterium]